MAIAVAGAAVFLYLRNFLARGIPFQVFGDQQQFFTRGLCIVHGQLPFRDFFAFVTPGNEYLYAAGFRVFGVHAWVLSAWSVATGLAFCWVLTRIATFILPERFRFLPALLFLSFDYQGAPDLTHHWFSTLAGLAAAAVLMRGVTLTRLAVASALCAVATLFTQTAGFAVFIAVAIYVVWQAKSESHPLRGSPAIPARLAAICLPYGAILAIVLGFFARVAGFGQLFFQLVLFAPRYFSSDERNDYLHQFPPLHGPSDLLRFIPVLFVYLLVPYIYAIGLFRLVRVRETMSPAVRQNLVLLNLVGILLFASVANSPRLFRLTTIAAPAILIFAWLLSQPGRARKMVRDTVTCIALAFAVFLPIHRQIQWHGLLSLPIGRTAFIDPLEMREFAWLAAHSHPGQRFFNNSGLALYLDLRNPTGLEYITTREFTRPEWVARAVAAMEDDPPAFVVLQSEAAAQSSPGDHSAPFRNFVQRHYDRVAVFPLNGAAAYQEEIWQLRATASP
ncbi:MAG TPA: hypothetical protein VII58_14360 [Acidobacteriaceae bacterium]